MIKFAVLAIVINFATLIAQQYYEASGQTTVFTIAAGQKAEWNKTLSAVLPENYQTSIMPVFTFSAKYVGNNIIEFNVPNNVLHYKVSLFDIRGGLVQSETSILKNNRLLLSRPLPNGRYIMYITSGKSFSKAASFIIMR